MSKQLRELQSRKSTLVKEARSFTDRIVGENRDMTDEEVTAFDALRTRIDAASAAIDREIALIADEARISITSAIGPIVTDNRDADPKRGFGSIGEFMQAVYQADKPGNSLDGRLLGGINAAAPSTFSNEAAGQDRGFLVPPQFSSEIFKLSLGEDRRGPRCVRGLPHRHPTGRHAQAQHDQHARQAGGAHRGRRSRNAGV